MATTKGQEMANVNLMITLNLLAARAQKLANDASNNRLWPGDLERVLVELQALIAEARNHDRS
jgi:hypothetical protein